MRVLLMGLNAFDDLVFNIVQRLGVLGRTIFRASLSSALGELQLFRHAVGVEVQEHFRCRTIGMLRLAQHAEQPGDAGLFDLPGFD